MGKLIVLEGTDGSGKSTQFSLLCRRLQEAGTAFTQVRFPQYEEPSSALIRMYLAGEFGSRPGDVNAYTASTFYAVDRFASYRKLWQKPYEAGGLILTDRYTTSNAVHQGSKEQGDGRTAFFKWLYDLEYEKMGLPRPNLVLYLDMPLELTRQLMRQREEKTHTQADIHEKDLTYLAACKEAARDAAAFYGWRVIPCAENGRLRSVEAIQEEIYRQVLDCLKQGGQKTAER